MLVRPKRLWVFLLAAALLAICSSDGLAVPYASQIRNVSGNTWEFVLNQAASSITITRDGGNPLVINNPLAGRHTFSMSGFSNFSIQVDNTAAAGWTRISDPSNLFTNYERPSGLAISTNPASPYFGTVYVNNSNTAATASGRAMGDGIYAISSDMQGVDLATFSVVTDPQDISQAKAPPSWNVSGSANSAWKMSLDEAGNVIVSDWSDANGGVKFASANLTSGGLLLDQQGGPQYGVQNSMGQPIHGSIVSNPQVTGSIGNNLTLYAMDEDLETAFLADNGNSVWRWNVGNTPSDYDGAPELVINASNLGLDSEGHDIFLGLSVGVLANSHYESRFNKWYLTQNRNDGIESGLVVVTADGVDGNSPTVNWSSGQFSIDNLLDGWFEVPDCPNSQGTNDIFRNTGNITISADGTKMFLHRIANPLTAPNCATGTGTIDYENRYLGPNSNLPGAVLVIPLDANGIPDIDVSDNGTPGDPSDDFITNLESITIDSNNSSHTRAEVMLDAAGNAYTTNNISELVEVFSPGGRTRAITTSSGTFSVQTLSSVTGDFNNDGNWNCDDINALTAAVASGSTDLSFDMNGDGMVTVADVNQPSSGWLAVGGAHNPGATGGDPFLAGDANLNGSVDGSDFGIWNSSKFTSTSAWCSGDFNASGAVDGSDFGIWNSNKFTSSLSAAVPEPTGVALWFALAAGCLLRRRK